MSDALSAPRSAANGRRRGLPVAGLTVVVVALSLAAWLGALVAMADMDASPGTPLHTLPVFLVGWVVMLTAMMLPSELTYIGAFAALLEARDRDSMARSRIVACFVTGYGVAWLAYGLAAYALDSAVHALGPGVIAWTRGGPALAASVLIVAGLYQVSSLKQMCLTHCRSPLSFFARNWRAGGFGAIEMGVRHGLVCVGCCWAMMAVMLALGAMSLAWMALLALLMFAEKVLPHGRRLSLPIATFLWAMAVWVAVAPDTAPLLKNPLVFGGMICRSR